MGKRKLEGQRSSGEQHPQSTMSAIKIKRNKLCTITWTQLPYQDKKKPSSAICATFMVMPVVLEVPGKFVWLSRVVWLLLFMYLKNNEVVSLHYIGFIINCWNWISSVKLDFTLRLGLMYVQLDSWKILELNFYVKLDHGSNIRPILITVLHSLAGFSLASSAYNNTPPTCAIIWKIAH